MKRVVPYYENAGDWLRDPVSFVRAETNVSIEATEIPEMSIPRFSFIYLLEGEILCNIAEKSYLIRGGQLFLLPPDTPFSIHHFTDLVGYQGTFDLSFLPDASYPCLASGAPVLYTYWFEAATFVGQIMERISTAYARRDFGYISRSLDLIFYSLQTPGEWKAHPLVNRFMEMLFDRSQVLDGVSGYAARLGISPSYLNKLVRTQTRHSAMDWVEIARVNWAKNLLEDRSRPVSEVAFAVGIDDPSYFTRFFRKATGMTPSEFRQQMKP